VAKDACAATHGVGIDPEKTNHMHQINMAILIHPYWGIYHFAFPFKSYYYI